MADPYIGEIRMFAGTFNPAGWMFCEGQLLPISENEPLFVLLGTTYGGDGQETFALPDLRGRIPIHMGTSPLGTTYQIGEAAGVEGVTLTAQQIPAHTHTMLATRALGSSPDPVGAVTAQSRTANAHLYTRNAPGVTMSMSSVGVTGGSQPHTNFQPYLCVNFIISLFGIFPSQT